MNPALLDIPEYDYSLAYEPGMNKFMRRQLGIKKVLRVIRNNPYSYSDEEVIRMLKTRKSCSCWMCGNRRRWEGKTRQERLVDLEMQEEI